MNKNKIPTPPRWAQRFLEWYCRPELLEDLQGDLNEYFQRNCNDKGLFRARIIYIIDVIKFFRSYTFRKSVPVSGSNRILFNNFYKTAYRNLLKHKLTTSLNIVGLTLGISCFMVISIYVQHEYTFDHHYKNYERIYRVTLDITSNEANETIPLGWADPQLAEDLRELYPEVEDATGIIKPERSVSVKTGTATFQEDNFCEADSHYFGVFSHRWIAGNPAKALEEPYSIVVTESLSQKYFGNEDPLNKTLAINGEDYNVTGLIKDLPSNTDLKFDALLSTDPEDWFFTYLLFKSSTDVAGFQQKLDQHAEELQGDNSFSGTYHLEPLTDIHFNEAKAFDTPKGSAVALYAFSFIALLILIISCINYVNMGLAQSIRRQAEVGVRKIFGASKNHIRLQFIIESLLITFVSSITALFAVSLLLKLFQRNNILTVTMDTVQWLPLLIFVVAVLLLISIFSGSYLGLFQTNTNPVSDLKGSNLIGNRRVFSHTLIVIQFIIVVALIFSTRVVNRQTQFLAMSNHGFDKDQVMVLDVPTDQTVYPRIPALKNSLATLAGVNKVSLTGYRSMPSSELFVDTYTVKQRDSARVKLLNEVYVDENYFDALGIQLAAGRKFNPDDLGGKAVIVNEAMVKDLGWTNPLEQTIDYGISGNLSNDGVPVIGVVKDFSFHGLQRKAVPLMFYPMKGNPEKILIKLDNPDLNSIWAIEKVWRASIEDHPFEYRFLDDYFQQQMEKENTLQKLMNYFSGMCIIIGCLGLIGTMNISFAQNLKETGIRKILGAKNIHLLIRSWRNHLIQLVIASIIALPVAFLLMDQWLEDFSNKISIDLVDYVMVILVLCGAVLLIMSWQIVKFFKLNPLESIKQE